MQIYSVDEVFTPSTYATLTFIERNEINDKLFKAIRNRGQQIVVYGPSGSGKSTLLFNKLKQMYDDHIQINCASTNSFKDVIYQAFCDLDTFFKSSSEVRTDIKIENDFKSYFANFKSIYRESTGQTSTRAVPLQLTVKNLSKYLSHFNSCLVIEDFQKLPVKCRSELAEAMKIFMDFSHEYKQPKIIAIGVTGSAKDIIKFEPNMNNRVSEIKVSLMNKDELTSIINKGEKLLNIKFRDPIKNSIVHIANGLPSTVHHLCKNICYEINCLETQKNSMTVVKDGVFRKALEDYIEESSDSIKHNFRLAIRKPERVTLNYRLIIIHTLSFFPNYGASKREIIDSIIDNCNYYGMQKREAKHDVNWEYYLKSLIKKEYGGILMYNKSTNLFRFSDIKLLNIANSIFRLDHQTEFFSDIHSIHDVYYLENMLQEYLKEV